MKKTCTDSRYCTIRRWLYEHVCIIVLISASLLLMMPRAMAASFSIDTTTSPSLITGLWWNAAEPGWGASVTQQYGVMFVTIFSYDAAGNPAWYVASNCVVAVAGCSGSLYKVSGGALPTMSWNSANLRVAAVGTITLTFTDVNTGNMSYTVDGASATKSIARQVFATGPPIAAKVHVVLFTHIEDNTPSGTLGSDTTRTNYLLWRSRLLTMGQLARDKSLTWVLQPDWKFLLAVQQYDDASAMASTGGKNVLRYLRDSLGVVIDAHSHEAGGYNYTDVAYLLEQLGVGGSTVIGGHVWDPTLPEFAHWERFRVPVAGMRYPSASWRGDILMGSGTPNHTNDPIVSGVWRPKDPLNYWTDDPTANIAAVGAYKGDIAGIGELTSLYQTGQVASSCMLTSTVHISPSVLGSASSLTTLDQTVLTPLQALRSRGEVEVTDFTSLIATWKSRYAGQACMH
ncbi:hypothetical protein BH11PSE11_BH11PSE11_22930 [soil metagenome]